MKTKILHLLGLLILMLLPTWAFAQTHYDQILTLSDIQHGKVTIHVDSLRSYTPGTDETRRVLIRVKNGVPLEITFPENASQITREGGRIQITSSNTVIIKEPILFAFSYMQNGIEKDVLGNVNHFGVAMFDGQELDDYLCLDGDTPKVKEIIILQDEDLKKKITLPTTLYNWWMYDRSANVIFAENCHEMTLGEILNKSNSSDFVIEFSDGSSNMIADSTAENGRLIASVSFIGIKLIDGRVSSISSVDTKNETPLAIYTLQGIRIPELQQGINILLYPSGRREKVYIPWGFPLQI